MLIVETIGRIQREYFLKGKTIKEIGRDLRVSCNTLRKVVRSGATAFTYDRDVQPRPRLERWTGELEALLAGNSEKPAREQLTLIRSFEELRQRVRCARLARAPTRAKKNEEHDVVCDQ